MDLSMLELYRYLPQPYCPHWVDPIDQLGVKYAEEAEKYDPVDQTEEGKGFGAARNISANIIQDLSSPWWRMWTCW